MSNTEEVIFDEIAYPNALVSAAELLKAATTTMVRIITRKAMLRLQHKPSFMITHESSSRMEHILGLESHHWYILYLTLIMELVQ